MNFSGLYFLYIITTCLTIVSLIVLILLLSLKSAGKNVSAGVIRLLSVLLIVCPLPYAMSNILQGFSFLIVYFSLDQLFALINELILCFIQIVLFIFVLFSMDESFFDHFVRMHPNVSEEGEPLPERTTRPLKNPKRSLRKLFGLAKAAFVVAILTCAIQGYIIYELIVNGNSFDMYLIQVLGFLCLALFFAFLLFSNKKSRVWLVTVSFFAYSAFSLVWDGANLVSYGLGSLTAIAAVLEFFVLVAFCLLMAGRAAKIHFPPLIPKILALVLIALAIPDFVIITKQFIDFTVYYYTNMNSATMIQVSIYILQQIFIFFILVVAYLMLYKSFNTGFYEKIILARPERLKKRRKHGEDSPFDPEEISETVSGTKDDSVGEDVSAGEAGDSGEEDQSND